MDKVNKLPSLIEAQNDINLTSYDLVWLSKVENAISMLINHSQVENKDYYGRVLRVAQENIAQGERLKTKIQQLITEGKIV